MTHRTKGKPSSGKRPFLPAFLILWLLASLLLFVRANQRVQALEEEKARLSELMWAVSQGETLTEEEKELVFSGRYSEIDGELYGGRRSGAYWQQRRALASTALSGFLLAVCLIEALRRTLYQNDDP